MGKTDVKEVRKGEELAWDKLESYLKENIENLNGDMTVGQFYGGHANLTYLLKFGEQEFVLRRPPFGKIAPGAHDMKREYRVLSKLYKHLPQAPRAYHLCMDDDIIGSRFVIIERRNGVVIRSKLPACFADMDNVNQRLTDALVQVTADLHTVDVETADLTKLGRPDGFAQRQLEGWYNRWNLSKTEESADMDRVFNKLSESVPTPQAVAIIHNDLKFDNCQFSPDNPDLVTSIFDWDMTTLGDPLFDFGILLSYWPEEMLKSFKILPLMLEGDVPDKNYLIYKYQSLSGYDLSNIKWYECFAYWKNAVVLQQLYKRYVDGATKDERMAMLGQGALLFANVANAKINW